MNASPPVSPPKALLRLPEGMRLQLALFALWRRRQAESIKTTTLAICLALSSGVLGYVLAQPPVVHAESDLLPSLAAAQPGTTASTFGVSLFPSARQWGKLQAEVLRLRLLYGRIAEASELKGAEFALAVQLADERYLDSFVELEDTPEAAGQRFTLATRAIDHMTDQAQLMLGISERRQQERNYTLSGSPVTRARITSRYGYRTDPRSGRKRFHRGLDFGGPTGSRVFALADGVVTYSGQNGGYGNLVELEHADGYRTRYAHNTSNLVSVGSRVSKGQAIATMGSTGKSTGTHVHVEVRQKGQAIDPLKFIASGS